MELLTRRRSSPAVALPWALAALAAFGLLTLLLRRSPENGLDLGVLEWVMSWDAPGLEAFMEAISWLTDLQPRVVLGVAAVGVLFVLGHRVAALSVTVTFVVLLGPIEFLDWASGVAVGRFRPNGAPFHAFPSGHTLGTVIMFGFVGYLVFRLPFGALVRIAAGTASAILIVAVGPSRLFLGVHWPTDVVGAYLLGAAALIGFIVIYETLEYRLTAFFRARSGEEKSVSR
jgi:undecaprenyl-diphosphatase